MVSPLCNRFWRWLASSQPKAFDKISSIHFFSDGAIISVQYFGCFRYEERRGYVDIDASTGVSEGVSWVLHISESMPNNWQPVTAEQSAEEPITAADRIQIEMRFREYFVKKSLKFRID